jgi:hypothetical protein
MTSRKKVHLIMAKQEKTRTYTTLISAAAALALAWFALGINDCALSTKNLWLRISIFLLWGVLFVLALLGRGDEIKAQDAVLIGLTTLIFFLARQVFHNSGSPEGEFALIYLTLLCLVAATK